ncbi:MAG TPA: PLD nuclease N-terminal domain-containing protein [Actinophytocola sp.]|nr:PLD nuclease N-terminal domain-containing protein [Actinophytocola sp.]
MYQILHAEASGVRTHLARGGDAVTDNRGCRAWHDLSPRQRRWLVLLGAVQAGLLAAALRDVVQRSAAELTAPKPVWVGACFVNIVGPLAYFLFGRRGASCVERRRARA